MRPNGRLGPLTLWVIAALVLISASPAAAQSNPVPAAFEELSATVKYEYGVSIVFTAQVRSDQPIDAAILVLTAEGDNQTQVFPASVAPLGESVYELQYQGKLEQHTLRAFSHVVYHYELQLSGGEVLESTTASLYYEDNRYNWQTRKEAPFTTHWYDGDETRGQEVLDIAQDALKKLQSLIPFPKPGEIDIYVYASAAEMQETLLQTRQGSVAGHADPDLGVMVVALPPGPDQQLLSEQRIPHELAHILLYQATGNAYRSLPVWLTEGLASIAELYPNPDYQILLENAWSQGTLLPIASLCQPFPKDASGALLGYAESASFTRFLHENYGSSGLQALVSAFANGLGCEQGVEAALAMPLATLERDWRQQTFRGAAGAGAIHDLAPWLFLLLGVLIVPLSVSLLKGFARIRTRKNPPAARE